MLFLAKALAGDGRLTPVGVRTKGLAYECFRTDARTEGSEIWIGGWALDDQDTMKRRWFAEKITHEKAPWLYAAGESYRHIASLELLSTLAAVVAFGLGKADAGRISCSAGTDNKGNSFVVSRLLTTKFPLCAFLIKLALQLRVRRVNLELNWLPRLQNVEADALTNNDTTRFDPCRRIRFDLQDFKGLVMGEMLAAGTELYAEIKKQQGMAKDQFAQSQSMQSGHFACDHGYERKESQSPLGGALIRCDLLGKLLVSSLYYPCTAGLLRWSRSHFSPLQGCESQKESGVSGVQRAMHMLM